MRKVINKVKRTSLPLSSPHPKPASTERLLDNPLTTWVSLEALATASPRSEKYLPEARGVTTGMSAQKDILPYTLPKAPIPLMEMPSLKSPKEMFPQPPMLALQLPLLGNGRLKGFYFGLDCIYPLQHLLLWWQQRWEAKKHFISFLHSLSPSSSQCI